MMSEQTAPDCAEQRDQDQPARPSYARETDVKVGDVLITDGGFTCMPAGVEKIVRADDDGELCIPCDHGLHKLEGQLGYTDETEGLYVGLTMKPTGRRIYVASSWRNAHQPEVVARLRSAGHEVYDFRNPAPGNTGFAWSAIDPDWIDWDPQRFVDLVTRHPVAAEGFGFDKRALDWCDTCVLVLPCGRSAHLEAGYAAGQGKTVLFLLHEDRFEPELMYLLGSGFACSLDELLAHPRLAEPPHSGPPPRWRHVARGSDYVEVGRAKVQNSLQLIDEGDTIVVYRGADGKLWAREEGEFEDGRFVQVEAR